MKGAKMRKLLATPAFRFLALAALCTAMGLELLPPDRNPGAGDRELWAAARQPLESQEQEDLGRSGSLVWPSPPAPPTIRFLARIPGPDAPTDRKSLLQRLGKVLFAPPKETGMIRPLGLVAKKGVLYVTDPGARALFIFDLEQKSVQKITKADSDLLVSPIGIALHQDRIFVSDSYLRRILVYDRRGRFVKTFAELQLQRPTGLALDERSGRLYVTDTAAHQVLIYSQDGKLEKSFGGRGTGQGEFNYPTHLWLDGKGALYVVDSLNFRIQVFQPDGAFVAEFGHQGDGSGDFSSPKGIAADSRGHLYVVDALFDAIQIFDRQGQLLLAFGQRGIRPGQFWLPAGVFVDEEDRIYVADSYNHRIQVFEFVGGGESR